MKARFATVAIAALAAAALAAASAGAAMIGIYRNTMETTAQRAQLVKLSGGACSRGGAAEALRVKLGKRTAECAYRTPVVGRDLEVAVTARLLSGTPKALQRRAYLALELRAGGGAKYQLRLMPLQRKAQLLRITPAGVRYIAVAKDLPGEMGLNRANKLRLRALNVTAGPEKGQAKIAGFVGGALVVEATDTAAGELAGRFSAFSAGATTAANGLVASFDDLVVRIPSPY